MKHDFSEAELDRLYERTALVAEKFETNEKRYLSLSLGYVKDILFHFNHEGMPEVDSTTRYMAEHYSSVSTMVPGLVNVDTIEEAHEFLDLVEAHEGSIDYEAVLKCAAAVHDQGWRDAIYRYVGDGTSGLPAEACDTPEGFELGDLDGAALTTTINASTVYGSHGDIEFPKDDENALLVEILGGRDESHVELEWPLEAFKVSGLEAFLVKQLLCTDGRYAFVLVDLMGGVFLDTVEENAEFLVAAVNSKGFLRYYEDENYRGVNERLEAVNAWTDAAGLPRYGGDEWYAKLEEILW